MIIFGLDMVMMTLFLKLLYLSPTRSKAYVFLYQILINFISLTILISDMSNAESKYNIKSELFGILKAFLVQY